MTFVDSNIVIDVIGVSGPWSDWSRRRLEIAASRGPLLINDVVYAEVSAGLNHMDETETAVKELGLTMAALPRSAAFRAGQAFARYKREGGLRTGVLADFFIGAHALAEGVPLLTRDRRRFPTYFPELVLIVP